MKNHESNRIDRRKLLNIVYLIFFAGLSVFALYYCFKKVKFDEFMEQLKSANYYLVALSALTGFIATIIRAFRWNIMLQPLGYGQSVFDTYNSLMIGYLTNLAVPRMGELLRCTTLNKTSRIPINSSFGTVVTERIFDFVCLMFVSLLTFLLNMNIFSRFINEKVLPEWRPVIEKVSSSVSVISIATVVAVVAGLCFGLRYLLRKIRAEKIKNIIQGLIVGMKSIFQMKKMTQFMCYTAGIWLCYWFSGFLILKSLPFTAHLGAVDGLFLLILGTLAWVVPAPGGFGTFHFIVALGLTMYNIPQEQGLGVATLSHESQLLLMILFGLLSALSLSLTKIKLKNRNYEK
ncbi:MAG: flippase-like domain-containing protein [Prevotellaceae bacterium]|jgi:uncharacterized protein (TIRG00374 family)|nr:flippase-like domain-containing protein [Prevotellaceae bacterium]